MKRLTIEKCGELLIKNSDDEYRSPCLGCESIGECKLEKVSCGFYKALEKLKDYEDLEEQGKLVRLPCKIGDRIYRVGTDEEITGREIEIHDIDNIVIISDGTILLKEDAYDSVICEVKNIVTDKLYLDLYKCFLTQEEAKAALKGCEEI